MASLNLSTNGPSIKRSYQSIVDGPAPSANSPTYAQWAVYSVQAPLTSAFQQDSSKESVLKVQTTGEGELDELLEEFSDGRIQFAFAKLKDPNSGLPKCVLISWCGEGVPERTKGYFNTHRGAVSKLLHGYHVEITARSDSHLSPESIIEKVSNASGAKYGGGSSTSDKGASASRGPPPPAATKPVFMPTRTGGSLLASRSKPAAPTSTDNDGWGEDAPQLSRNTLEKVESAYKPTKVNMAELTSQKQQPSRFQPPSRQENGGPSDIVRGGYQPIGKVDINAIRSQAREQKDDRPTIVKGAYEPVGKVDIAAIRAKAQGAPTPAAAPAPMSQSRTGDDEDQAPKSLADRSAAFTQSSQSGRLSEMPKPKVANRFGSATSSFAGTKAPTPVGFGVPPPAASAPIGAASKNFASTDGKSPAQLWAEKKARERGLSGAGETAPPPSGAAAASPMQSQPSGGWQSGYSGKSWAPVSTDRTGASNISAQKTGQDDVRSPERETEPELPSGGVSALKDRFKNAAPMGASNVGDDSPAPSMPPPMDFSSKPNAGLASRSVPLLPKREMMTKDLRKSMSAFPLPPAQPRSPTPSPPSSPIRVAMPVSRSAPVEPMEAPEERFDPPPMPTQSMSNAASAAASHMRDEPEDEEDHARAAAEEASATTFGASAAANANPGADVAGKRALVQYDYEKAEDNEIELREGEYVENIEMVDEDWWMGQNSQGETGLFPSNYVELVEDDDAAAGGAAPPPPAPARDEPAATHTSAPAAAGGQTATAQYDYEAAEDNELSFPDGAKITDVDWWFGHYNGQQGLFPANYVELDQ
ncbi:unnamed protein product [Aureobasidium vineae]|uniref:Actin binding protein n=1 Tax=Aureobasidium vineae TaxID=2773715 RepID=A0A9N8JQL9_9PEZI|nr:unnamed protein product [Aureobasidium vineae]